MIQVRDKLQDGYKGRPTWAVDPACSCRPCYNPHDCGRRATDGEWLTDMYCLTNYNNGCPDPRPDPIHILRRLPQRTKGQIRKCVRCGCFFELDIRKFKLLEEIKI